MNYEFPIGRTRKLRVSPKAFFSASEPKQASAYNVLPKCDLARFPPNNEEVAIVYLAGLVAPFLRWKVVTIQEAFPDATYEELDSGKLIRVEFEKTSRDFLHHGHDPKGCDYILCWEDTLTRAEKRGLLQVNPGLRLLELRRIFLSYDFELL